MGKADQEAAYKTLPLLPGDRKYATLAIRHPTTGVWWGFRPNTQLFGATASVLHYNIFSRFLISLFSRIFLVPGIAYFDDFGWFAPIEVLSEVTLLFSLFMDTIGAPLKKEKNKVWPFSYIFGVALLAS